jgi:hypothetical protein
VYPNAPHDEEPDNEEWLTFWDTSSPPLQLELGQVPALIFSEVVRELTPKTARPRQQPPRRAKLASETRTSGARASNTACIDEICGLVSRLAGSAESRADARRLSAALDERAQRVIEVFTTGKARTDAEACALLGLTPAELTELTALVLRTFAPVLRH